MTVTQREMWVGSVFVVEWDLVDIEGDPVGDAEVTGTVTRDVFTAAMVIDHTPGSNTYRASWAATASGTYGYKLVALRAGLPAGATEATFAVGRDITGAEPITVDLTTSVGKIRLLTTDLDEAFPLLTDAQITALLEMEGGNVKRGAAACLETMATSETMVTKKITTQDLSIDGPAVADDLRKRAKLLRDQADNEDPAGADITNEYGFDSVDFPRHGVGWPYTRGF